MVKHLEEVSSGQAPAGLRGEQRKSKGLGERHTGFQLVLQCTATQPQANGLSFAHLANRIVILLLQGVNAM